MMMMAMVMVFGGHPPWCSGDCVVLGIEPVTPTCSMGFQAFEVVFNACPGTCAFAQYSERFPIHTECTLV